MNVWKYLLYIFVLVQAQAVFADDSKPITMCPTSHSGANYECRQEASYYLDGIPSERSDRSPASVESSADSP
ncbi:MAG: hypothetical protein H7061_11950 [Bdellovibrionaceae bacterium]|nr:hypothetical protein [Bdellovibrio sp.]